MSILNKLTATDERTSLIRKNIFFSLLIKGWSAVVVFAMVPLTLNCLGSYKNGVWLTISSLLIWIDNMDIGLGNGLRNLLSEEIAVGDIKGAGESVSSAFGMLFVVIIPICIALSASIFTTDIYAFLNVDKSLIPDLANALLICIIFVCSTFVLKFIGNVYMALQLPAISNLIVCIGQTLALIGTLIVYHSGSESLLHIAFVNTCAPLLAYLASYPYTFYFKYRNIRPSVKMIRIKKIRMLFSTGVVFFFIQISGAILFLSSNLLLSRLFSPEMVTPYQIAYRYFYIPLLAFTIICTPYWSATTDALSKGDSKWIKKSNISLNKIVVLFILVIALMAVTSGLFYNIWIGKAAVIPFGITAMMAVYTVITIVSLRYSFILNGLNALRLQLITTVSAAIVFVPVAVYTVEKTSSMVGFMVVLCGINIPGMIINKIQLNKIINNTATGIWKK